MRNAVAVLILSLTIALLPIYNRVSSFDINRTSKDNLLLVVLAFLTVLLSDEKRKFPIGGWIASVIAVSLVVINQHNSASILVMMQCFYFVVAVAFFIRLYECFDLKFIDMILNAMCIGVLIQCVYVLFAHFGISIEYFVLNVFNDGLVINDIITPAFGGAIGTLGNPNLLGSYVAICSMAFIRKKWILLSPLAVICMLSTGSIMGILSFFAGLTYYLLNFKKPIYLMTIVSMFLIPFFDLKGIDSGRFEIWKGYLSSLNEIQIAIGSGLGWFADQRFRYQGTIVAQEHNAFLSLFNVFGLFGVLIFFKYLWDFINTPDHNKLFASILFVIFCNSFGHFTLHQSTVIIPIIVALIVCSIGDKNDELERPIFS